MGSRLGFLPTNYEKSNPLKFGFVFARLIRIFDATEYTLTNRLNYNEMDKEVRRGIVGKNGNSLYIYRHYKDKVWTVTMTKGGIEKVKQTRDWLDLIKWSQKFILENCACTK